MKKIVVLGAGLVGNHVAKDLATSFDVTSVDYSQKALDEAFKGTKIKTKQADCSNPDTIKKIVEPFDVVVGALPGFMGKKALKAVIEAGKNTVDIAFFPEDPFDLDELAKKNNVTALIDFGVAPGMSNVFMGYHAKKMKSVDTFDCLVGGLPAARVFPFEYKAPFSPCDVVEEYTRPTRYIENGVEVVRPALTDPEMINFDGIGTLEALNTDGLRTVAKTHNAPNMKEKTLRYPGHGRFMQALRDAGFFSKDEIEINGTKIRPLDFTSAVMFPSWQPVPGEDEFTVMRVTVSGVNEKGQEESNVWDLHDRYDMKNGVSSMARTTGYACTAGVHLLANEKFTRKGICPPEYVGEVPECFDFLIAYQKERNINYKLTTTTN